MNTTYVLDTSRTSTHRWLNVSGSKIVPMNHLTLKVTQLHLNNLSLLWKKETKKNRCRFRSQSETNLKKRSFVHCGWLVIITRTRTPRPYVLVMHSSGYFEYKNV